MTERRWYLVLSKDACVSLRAPPTPLKSGSLICPLPTGCQAKLRVTGPRQVDKSKEHTSGEPRLTGKRIPLAVARCGEQTPGGVLCF